MDEKPYDPAEHQYPKMRHHPTEKAKIVHDPDQEEAETPDAQGWTDSLGDAQKAAKKLQKS